MKPSDFGSRLTKAIDASGLKKVDFCRQIRIAPAQLSPYISEGMVPRHDLLVRMAKVLGVTVDWLLTGRDHRTPVIAEEPATYGGMRGRLLPVLDWVQAGRMTTVVDPYPYAGVAEDYLAANVKGKRCFALKVRGDSMEPEFREGDLIVVDPDRQPQAGEFVVVKSDEEGEATFKKYVRLRGEAYLRPVNQQNYPDIKLTDTHRIVGKVIRLHRLY